MLPQSVIIKWKMVSIFQTRGRLRSRNKKYMPKTVEVIKSNLGTIGSRFLALSRGRVCPYPFDTPTEVHTS